MENSTRTAPGHWEWEVGVTHYSLEYTPPAGESGGVLNWSEDVSSWDDDRGNGTHAESTQTVAAFLQEGPPMRPSLEIIEAVLAHMQAEKPVWLDTYRLQKAVNARNIAAVEELLEQGVEADRPIFGLTAFYLSVVGKEFTLVERFLAAGVDVNRHFPHNQETILMALAWWAPDATWEPLIRRIIALGADLEAQNQWGETPLMAAAIVGERLPWYVLLLIDAGANVNARSQHGYTPLWKAVSYRYCPLETIRQLIAAGADVNACDKNGFTVLMEAISNSLVEGVRCLLAAGADVHAVSTPVRKTEQPKSVLQVALDYAVPEIVSQIDVPPGHSHP